MSTRHKTTMLRICIAAVVVFFALAGQVRAQALPAMTYGGIEDDRAYALVEASDTGYVLAGWTKSFGPGTPGFTNVLIVKVDTFGIPIWSKISIGLQDDEAYSMTRTSDGGYAITGITRSYGLNAPAFSNIFVLKLDVAGNLQWGWVYSELPTQPASNEEAYSIIQTLDNGYAVTGWTDMGGTRDIFLLKIDASGVFQFFKTYWFAFVGPDDEGYSICETYDPNIRYLIAGRANIFQSPSFDAFVINVDQFGNPVPGFLASIITGQYQDQAYSVLWDGTAYVAAGWTNTTISGTPDILIWKANIAGQFMIGRTYGWDIADEMVMDDRSLILTADTNYAVSGWTNSVGPGAPPNPNFLILKLDTLLNLQWGRVHPSSPGAMTEEAYPMIQTLQSQKFGIAGWTDSYCVGGPGDEDFHFLTLDSQGNRPVCVIDTMPPFEDVFADIEEFSVDSFYMLEDAMEIMDEMVEFTEICTIIPGTMEIPRTILQNDLEIYTTFEGVTIRIGKPGRFDLTVYDVTGAKVSTLAHGMFEQGAYSFTLPMRTSAGVYFIRANLEGIGKSVKLVKLR